MNSESLIKSGAHFGHPVSKWNPQFKKFILSVKNGVHIINMDMTIEYLDKDSENINSKVKNIRILINSSHKLILDNCNNAPEAINVTQILLLAISTSEIIMTAQGHRFIGLLRQRINELVNNIVKNN